MSSILVTGASGFIGSHLVAALARGAAPDGSDVAVRALVRSDDAAGRLGAFLAQAGVAPDAVEMVRGDVLDSDSLGQATRGAGVVYHLAGGYRGSAAEMREVHVEGTNRLLGALGAGTRLVHVSSTSVYGWDQAWPADEQSPARPESAYGRAKLAAERLALRWGGGDTVVARPTIAYGPGDERGMLPHVVALLRRGLRLFPGDGRNRLHLLHVDDLVRALVVLGSRGQGTYVLCGPEAVPMRRIAALAAEGAGVRAPAFGVPAPLLRPLASVAETLWAAAGRDTPAPVTRHGVDVVTRDRAYSCARAERDLGWRPEIGADEGIPAAAREIARRAETRAAVARAPVPGLRRGGGEGGGGAPSLGFDWRSYVEDPDEGLGTVYERFALDDVLAEAVARTGSASVLHAPLFGMMGWPGVDAVLAARRGVRVGLLDFDADRLDTVVKQWRDLGLDPESHLVAGPDPSSWPEQLDTEYDLVFSFAALWWFDDIDGVLAAQSRWARRGVLCCVPNRNVFLRARAALWHRELFTELNPDALDYDRLLQGAGRAGLSSVGTGLFDIPPFPDTSVPLAKLVRSLTGRSAAPASEDGGGDGNGGPEQAWSWSILPYLAGDDPEMPDRIARLARWERYLPSPVAPALAHHRYVLFEPSGSAAQIT